MFCARGVAARPWGRPWAAAVQLVLVFVACVAPGVRVPSLRVARRRLTLRGIRASTSRPVAACCGTSTARSPSPRTCTLACLRRWEALRARARVGGAAPVACFFGSCRSPPRVCSLAHTRPRPPAVQVPGAPHVRDVQRPGLQAPVHEQVEPAADGPRARPPVHEGCVRRCERTRVPAGARGAAA